MTQTRTHEHSEASSVRSNARGQAEAASTQRLLNSFLSETGIRDPRVAGEKEFRVLLSSSGHVLTGSILHWSPMGHHVFGPELRLTDAVGTWTRPVDHRLLTDVLLGELSSLLGTDIETRTELSAQVDNSVESTARYLERGRGRRPRSAPHQSRALTRYAEQSLLMGHPLHPTPKSAEGFDDAELDAYAPELGAEFALHYFAVAPHLLRSHRVADGEWLRTEVAAQARTASGGGVDEGTLLPVHPWQAAYLLRQPRFLALVEADHITDLGPLGPDVYPTSSVRTVCDPDFTTAWKLPLHVRITNFVRNNPVDQIQRALDASAVVAGCRPGWDHPGFHVLIETGALGLADAGLAADTTVLFRENPFASDDKTPQVVAGLLEAGPDGAEPQLIDHVREACGVPTGPLPFDGVAQWLAQYLEISLVPLLNVFGSTGISFEAHVQNSLVHFDQGRPTHFYVRDMEGVSLSRENRGQTPAGRALDPRSALLYSHDEAWHRLQYYAVTNHFGHLVHVLGYYTGHDEIRLWSVARRVLAARPGKYAKALAAADTLPAKANLSSRLAKSSEHPSYVLLPNPIHKVAR
ncbi:IucA/IucC family protein [Streptomyces sp. NPDC059255]|uniref:IucA/IucC family protein n=1 Tax=Streptomyces sp. NPDC059255 TaxID=3346793 RepID=UPI0036CFDF8E